MDRNRIARLTEQQRTCLRFVYSHMTSKEIAPLMGIEPGSVDQHIKAAMRVLGVGDRRSAARILAEHEGREGVQPLVYQPPDIATTPHPGTFGPPIESGWQSSGLSGATMREEQASFRVATSGGAPTLPLPIGTTRPGDLNWLTRLAWIAAIAIGVALAFGALVSAIEALGRLTTG
ncbi:MAG TPA: helix-turn-helix transcriptional regulator [Allosphingosinicella sp.]